MKITPVPAGQLTPEHVRQWSALQRADAGLDSPFLCPEFTLAVASVRSDVEVAVLEEDGEVVGFFPYQRNRRNVAGPVGGRLNCLQGIVVRKGTMFRPVDLLRGCRLTTWHFDHLVTSQEAFRPYHFSTVDAPFVDISQGFEAYQAARRSTGSQAIKKIMRKARKAAREAGPLRFEPLSTDEDVFRALIGWKSAQYRRTGKPDVFSYGWTVDVLREILRERTEAFGGILSALYLGDQLAAVQLDLRSYGVIHGWFPTYNRAFAKHSPGEILRVEHTQWAASQGIGRIELGKVTTQLKSEFMSAAVPVAEGAVDCRPGIALAKRNWSQLRRAVLGSSLRRPARAAARTGARVFPPLARWLALTSDDSAWKQGTPP